MARPGYRHRIDAGPLHWVFARVGEAFYVAGADNSASLRLHAALGFQEMTRFESKRSASGVDELPRLTRAAVSSAVGAVSGDE